MAKKFTAKENIYCEKNITVNKTINNKNPIYLTKTEKTPMSIMVRVTISLS